MTTNNLDLSHWIFILSTDYLTFVHLPSLTDACSNEGKLNGLGSECRTTAPANTQRESCTLVVINDFSCIVQRVTLRRALKCRAINRSKYALSTLSTLHVLWRPRWPNLEILHTISWPLRVNIGNVIWGGGGGNRKLTIGYLWKYK